MSISEIHFSEKKLCILSIPVAFCGIPEKAGSAGIQKDGLLFSAVIYKNRDFFLSIFHKSFFSSRKKLTFPHRSSTINAARKKEADSMTRSCTMEYGYFYFYYFIR